MSDSRSSDERTLLMRAQEKIGSAAFEELFSHYQSEARQWLKAHVSEALVDEFTFSVKADTKRNITRCGPIERPFPNLIRSRCLLILMKYYAEPAHDNAAKLVQLAEELESCTGFTSKCSREDLLLAVTATHKHEAFNQLWERHQKTIIGFLTIRVRDVEVVEEVVQETFLALRTRAITHFDPTLAQFQTLAKMYAEKLGRRYFWNSRRRALREGGLGPEGEDQNDTASASDPPDSGPTPDEIAVSLDLIKRLLWTTFSLESPPHQLIVFGLNKLLEREPREIVSQYSTLTLAVLEAHFEKDYVLACPLEAGELFSALETLRSKLPLEFRKVAKHRDVIAAYDGLLDRITGEITLEEFYTEDRGREDIVAKWTNNVWKRVRKKMLEKTQRYSRS